MGQISIGVDLGGTRIKAVAVSEGQIVHQTILPTNDGDDSSWKRTVSNAISELQLKVGVGTVRVGISAPGLPDQTNESIAFMPGRMQGLENFNWSKFLGLPSFVLNDAVAALLAEVQWGAAKDWKHVLMITLGTGVGGAILVNGEPYQGAFNKAGHVGHMVINDQGPIGITGMPGSLEECIGNVTVEKRSAGKFKSTSDLLTARKAGDAFADQVWLTSVRQLAIGIASLTNILSPEVVVLGGGITEADDDLFVPLSEFLSMYEWRAGGNGVKIVKATFGDMSGAAGAALFAMKSKGENA